MGDRRTGIRDPSGELARAAGAEIAALAELLLLNASFEAAALRARAPRIRRRRSPSVQHFRG
ncbi:MAG: hypothetical protein OHK0026_17590 [Rhodocyclaceae bacterium]